MDSTDNRLDPVLRESAIAARGFMPTDEGDALYVAARNATDPETGVAGPLVEIGSYCGKSSIWIGAAARAAGRHLFAIDHHRGSEENQAGWEHHEPDLVDDESGLMDTLPIFRRTIERAGLESNVIAVVGDSIAVAQAWSTPLAFLFIDGGHGVEPAHNDYEHWVPHVALGGTLAIHDVFPDPADGGRPPFEIWTRAIESGAFTERSVTGSLRILERTGTTPC